MFTDITELSDFIDDNLNTNGTNSITGANLNTGLQGIVQFLGASGVTCNIATGAFTGAIPADGVTFIPHGLSSTPLFAMVVAKDVLSGEYLAATNGYFLEYTSSSIKVIGESAPFSIPITDLVVDWVAVY